MTASTEYINPYQANSLYSKMFAFTNKPNNGLSSYSTNAVNIKTCYTSHEQKTTQISVYPGEEFRIPMTAMDKMNNAVRLILSLSLAKLDVVNQKAFHVNWWLSRGREVQVLPENRPCTNITVIKDSYKHSRANSRFLSVLQ